MIALDTNVLVYALRADSDQHEPARVLVRRLAEGQHPWALPVFVLGEFLRVATHPRVFSPPSTPAKVIANIDALLASPTVHVLSPGERYWRFLREAVREAKATGNLVFDAQIAAVCVEHGVDRLVTEDRDFARFGGIRAVSIAEA